MAEGIKITPPEGMEIPQQASNGGEWEVLTKLQYNVKDKTVSILSVDEYPVDNKNVIKGKKETDEEETDETPQVETGQSIDDFVTAAKASASQGQPM